MFYSTLTRHVPGDKGAINYAGVARWTAKEDLFNYDYIVVPINERSVLAPHFRRQSGDKGYNVHRVGQTSLPFV
jgi:hypothetical protein